MITLIEEKARIYFTGDTFAAKDQIKSLGGHWDADRRTWWIGKAKAAEARALAEGTSQAAVATAANEALLGVPAERKSEINDDSRLAGRGIYKGRSYYILWMGRCNSGEQKAHLTTLDAKIDFWAALEEVEVTKRYSPREVTYGYGRHRRTEYTTLGSIRRFVADQKNPDTRRGECTECGSFGPSGQPCKDCGGEGHYS